MKPKTITDYVQGAFGGHETYFKIGIYGIVSITFGKQKIIYTKSNCKNQVFLRGRLWASLKFRTYWFQIG